MSTQTLPGHAFPAPCQRCGVALYRQVDYCPYCGAVHPLDAGPHTCIVIPGNGASRPVKAAPHAAHADELADRHGFVLPDAPIPPLHRPPRAPGDRRGPSARTVLTAIAAVVVTGLVYVGYALFGNVGSGPADDTTQRVANEPAVKSSAGAITAYKPAASMNLYASSAAAANVTANLDPAWVPPYRDASHAMEAARAALRAHDLSAARNALSSAQTLRANSADTQSLQNVLDPSIARRDAALQAAQACAAQRQWACVRQQAGDALTLDTGSAPASALLERAIREAGWAPLGRRGTTDANDAKPTRAPASTPAASPLQAAAAQVQLPPLPPLPSLPPLAGDLPPSGVAAGLAATRPTHSERPRRADAWVHAVREPAWRRAATKRAEVDPPGTAASAAALETVTTATTITAAPAHAIASPDAERVESSDTIDRPESTPPSGMPDPGAPSR